MSIVIKSKPEPGRIPIATIESPDPAGKNSKVSYCYVDFEIESNADEVREYRAKTGEVINWHPYVLPEQRTAIFISGISGSGKSSFARHAIDELRKQKRFKKNEVYFITTKNVNNSEMADPAFIGLKDFFPLDIYREEFMDIDLADFRDCIVVFDDYNQLPAKSELYIHITQMLKKLLELGRKQNIQLIIINHQTMDYAKTRDIIFESDTNVLFPRSNMNATNKFISNYVSDNKALLADVSGIRGSQFTPLVIHKTAPSFMMTLKWIRLF